MHSAAPGPLAVEVEFAGEKHSATVTALTIELLPLDGQARVTFAEKDPAALPTADEIEARYDHSCPPSPLVAADS